MSKLSPAVKASRRIIKMEKIARLEIAGYSDTEIAMFVGITKQYVSMLRRTMEYVAIRAQVATGILAETDRILIEDQESTLDQLKQMVPSAILVMRNALHDNSNPKLRFEAAKEILDREGSFAKVSKSEIKKTEVIKIDENDFVANDLLAALQKQEAIEDKVTPLELSEEERTANLDKSFELINSESKTIQ